MTEPYPSSHPSSSISKPYSYSIFNFDVMAGLCQSPEGLDDVEHFDALPVRSPGLLFAGKAGHVEKYIDLWKTLDPDPTDKEIIRNFPIRQPLLWV